MLTTYVQGIATAAYGPLTAVTKGAGGPVDDILARFAKKYAVSPGEICLRWCIDQDVVPITTSGKEQRLSDYLRAMTFKLTPSEIKQVCASRALRSPHFIANRAFSRLTRPVLKSISEGSGTISLMPTTQDRYRVVELRRCSSKEALPCSISIEMPAP